MFIELYLNSHLHSFSEAIFILRVHDGAGWWQRQCMLGAQSDLYEYEANLVYRVSARTAMII